ncbi:MAG: STAS domain-containing protein [Gammaproteobacteria bacterium]|nr:STAS domain-containing protein [Gammaproteobacteria bacterium]
MTITARMSPDGGELSMTIDGRFDFNIHAAFRDAYRDVPITTKFVVDLTRTTFMDSAALGMLLLLREFVGEDASAVKIRNCRPDVRKVLQISNLDKLFTVE